MRVKLVVSELAGDSAVTDLPVFANLKWCVERIRAGRKALALCHTSVLYCNVMCTESYTVRRQILLLREGNRSRKKNV